MYKFSRCSKGPWRGAYGHPHFVRGRTDLCRLITRSEKVSVEVSPKSLVDSPEQQQPPSFDDSPYPFDMKTAKDHAMDFDFGCLSPYDMDLVHGAVSLSSFDGTPPDILDEIINTFAVPQETF